MEEGSKVYPRGTGIMGDSRIWGYEISLRHLPYVFFRAHVSKSVERMAKNPGASQIMIARSVPVVRVGESINHFSRLMCTHRR